MIKVIDDFLTPSYCNSIYELARHRISYMYTAGTSWQYAHDAPTNLSYDPLIKDVGQFSCGIFNNELKQQSPYSWAFEQLRPVYYTLIDMFPELEIKGTSRVKFNMLWQREDSLGYYNQPHVDAEVPAYSMVYYLNDSDGDTVIFNESYVDDTTPISLTVDSRIQPKKNRAVIFESNRYHASSNPVVSENRFVLNWVFWLGN